jgi:hypothetical protein
MVRKTQFLEGLFIYLEGGSIRNYKTEREKVLVEISESLDVWDLRPSAIALEKFFIMKINCLGLIVFVSPMSEGFRGDISIDCPLGAWMTFDPFCALEIEGSKSRGFQWDLRSKTKMIPLGPRLRLRGGKQSL